MGKELIKKLLPALNKMKWSEEPTATSRGRKAYDIGVEKVRAYTGDAKELMAALRTFQTGDSQPFACAGVAYTLVTASKEKDGSYDPAGLDAAMAWLEKAQDTAPEIVDINMIEALIYIYNGRFDDALMILDYLLEQEPSNFNLHLVAIAFWQQQKDIKETVYWYQEAMEAAATVPQKMSLQLQLGDFHLECDDMDKALEVYKEAIHFNKENALLWHKMSVIHWRQQNMEEAERCNQRALKLKALPAARQLEAAIKKKKAGPGLKGRLFGR